MSANAGWRCSPRVDSSLVRYAFEECDLDLDAMLLTVAGQRVPLEPQVFDVLQYLIQERHRVVPKSELLDRVWGHRFVTESALTSRIKTARRAIADDGRAQRLIRTVHGRGYQFVGEVRELEAAVAPAPVRKSRGLPTYVSEFVGRDCDLVELEALLDRARLVTVTGPGGVGKTRLAVACERRSHSREVAFVDLTVVGESALVMAQVAAVLGLQTGPTGALATVIEYLIGRRCLLILDNVEHVIDSAPEIGALVGAVDDLTVLATSRERLRVDGEHVFPLEPLDLESPELAADSASAAVLMFGAVARAAAPAFDVEQHRRDVERICRAVDGLPLAIELAAGQVRTLPPTMLASRLANRLGSASGTRRDRPVRHRTMSDTIDWSLHLITADELRLFTRLGAFVSDVPLSMIEAVCRDEALIDPVDALGRLVDQSLVRARTASDGSARFGMLGLLRERANQLLAEDDRREAVARRHGEAVAAAVEDLDRRRWGDLVATWLDAMADLQPEVRRALDWATEHEEWELAARIAGSLGAFWHREGGQAQGRRWLDAVLDHVDSLTDATLGRTLMSHGLIAWGHDDQTEARAAWSRAVEFLERTGDRRRLAYVLASLAVTELNAPEQYDAAMRSLDRGVTLAREVGEPAMLAEVLNIRGEFARVTGDDGAARAAYEEAASLAERIGDLAHLSIALANLSYLACHDGRYDDGRRIARRSLAICSSEGRRLLAAWSVSELAGPASGLGEPELAARLLGASEQAMEVLGGRRYPADVREHERVVAEVVVALGRERFDELRAEGARLPLDEAIRLALGSP